jgi:NhaP-type Na+/H+ or K+/H+ antiporter
VRQGRPIEGPSLQKLPWSAVPAPVLPAAGTEVATDVLAWTMWLMGVVLVLMALAEPDVQRLPLSASLIYLLIGWLVASAAGPLLEFDPRTHAPLLQVLTEWAVLISLFAVGLRLGAPRSGGPRGWRVATVLATVGMLLTIALATACAHWLLGLDWPAALLLAAILAPTDPVLASEVQLRSVADRDAVRLALTAEGGMNDGTAWPVVILALGLLGLHDLGPGGTQWLLRDLLWLIGGGLVLGWIGGRAVALALRARLHVGHALVWDELLYLGTIALSYGAASVLKVSAFLAVFAAGCALFHETVRQRRLDPEYALRRDDLSRRLVAFGGRCERLVEVTMVIFIGAALTRVQWRWELVAFAAALLFAVRPLAVSAVVWRGTLPNTQRRLIAWFGIRGGGSAFTLCYALARGVDAQLARDLVSAVVPCIAASVLLHGVSATPLMNWYQRRRDGGGSA